MENKRLFLIMEEDLAKRFTFFEENTEMPVHVLNLKNSLKQSKLDTIISRLSYKKNLTSEYVKLKGKLLGLSELYISNPEGYIAKNIIYFIRSDFPDLKIISLQHGIFALGQKSNFVRSLKRLVNSILKPILGYYVIGDGFGDKTTDKYIVYNSMYKGYLLDNGWKSDEVSVSSYYLKGEQSVDSIDNSSATKAILFLQCLHKLGITDIDSEMELITNIVSKLSKKYKEVLIKQHPYAKIDLPELPENTSEIESLPELKDISLIVSAFSTALLEYEKYGITAVSIKYDKLNVNESVYDQFLNIHEFDSNTDEFNYKLNDKRKNLPIFFEVGEMQLELL